MDSTVISSRIRLARNIRNLSFPQNYKPFEADKIYEFTFKAGSAVKSVENCETIVMSSLGEIDRQHRSHFGSDCGNKSKCRKDRGEKSLTHTFSSGL